MNKRTMLDIVLSTMRLFSDHNAWTQGKFARIRQHGPGADPHEPSATCWCLTGAFHMFDDPQLSGIQRECNFSQNLGYPLKALVKFNDNHPLPDVIKYLRMQAGLLAMREIRDIFTDKTRWCHFMLAKTKAGQYCTLNSPDAYCFCLSGAASHVLDRARHPLNFEPACQLVFGLPWAQVIRINDDNTYDEMMWWLQTVIRGADYEIKELLGC
jgi:hypothetical protein